MAHGAAGHYDHFSRRYDLAALVIRPLQRRAVRELRLRPGDTVYDLGCGTGLLLEELVKAVGPGGKVIAVDFSEGMLAVAKARAERHGWKNVELVQADLTTYVPPKVADAAIFCLSLSVIPSYEDVLKNAIGFVKPGGRIVVADSWKRTGRWYHRLSNAYIDFKAPYVSADPDNKVGECMERHVEGVVVTENLFGVWSIAAGHRPAAGH